MSKYLIKPIHVLGFSFILSLNTACQVGDSAGQPPPFPSPLPTPFASSAPIPQPTAMPTAMPTSLPSALPTAVPTVRPVTPSGFSFGSTLTGGQESPPVNTTAFGTSKIGLNANRSEAYIEIVTSGLSGPITGAHIHAGTAGENGAVVKDLVVNGNVISGVWRNSDAASPMSNQMLDRLVNGQLYVNVHTAAHPNGEIRGQINSFNDELYPVYLSSGQQVPINQADSSAAALVRVRSDEQSVVLEGYAHGLTGEIVGAHIHQGESGFNGPVIKQMAVENNHFTLTWSRTDAEAPLTDELLEDLRDGKMYMSIHTSNYPDGEVRGQIINGLPAGVETFYAFSGALSGSHEIPVVNTNAYGAAELRLHAEAREVKVTAYVAGLSGLPTSAHIHQGASGVNGPVVKELSINGNTITGTWRADDANSPLTVNLMRDLLAGDLYLNVHTQAHPGGEIRSQLNSTRNRLFALELTGGQEVPAVGTVGRGAAWVMLSPDHKQVTVMGSALNLTSGITAAHIHAGPMGLSGPVVKDLTVNGQNFSGTWLNTDPAQPLTYSRVLQLLNGEFYINVHTATYANGEVRGQIR